MRNFMLTLLMLVGMTSFGQESEPKVLNWDTPVVTVNNITYELLDVDEWGVTEIKFTRFNDNDKVIESGVLLNKKPHGKWKAYNPENGKIMSTAYYYRGERQKLETWSNGKLYTVVYKDNTFFKESPRIAYVQITGF